MSIVNQFSKLYNTPLLHQLIDDPFFIRPSMKLTNTNDLFDVQNQMENRLFSDCIEKADKYECKFDMPGFNKNDVKVHAHDNFLIVEGSRKNESTDEKSGTFSRTMGNFKDCKQLNANADGDNMKASFKDGVLTVSIPKKIEKNEKRKFIPIE